jgi:hypothetical protein
MSSLLLLLPRLLPVLPCSLGQLERSNAYLVQHSGMAAVRQALQHSQLVFNRALEQCDADFRASLAAGARAAAPPAAWLRSKLDQPVTGGVKGGGRFSRSAGSTCCIASGDIRCTATWLAAVHVSSAALPGNCSTHCASKGFAKSTLCAFAPASQADC